MTIQTHREYRYAGRVVHLAIARFTVAASIREGDHYIERQRTFRTEAEAAATFNAAHDRCSQQAAQEIGR